LFGYSQVAPSSKAVELSFLFFGCWQVTPSSKVVGGLAQFMLQNDLDTNLFFGCWQVTPSSKVVGDLAQFMVQNDLDEHSMLERAAELNFPQRSSILPHP